jgi:hypothetical protein
VSYLFLARSRALSRTLSLFTAILLSLGLPAGVYAEKGPHIRILDHELKALFDQGLVQSPTLRALVAEIERAQVLVFAECNLRLPSGIAGRLNFVTSVNGVRYVRVAIDCTMAPRAQVSLLAHEIQHALEVATHPDVVDVDAMESLYEGIGFPTTRDGPARHFETAAAKAVQRAVNAEMGRRPERDTAAY